MGNNFTTGAKRINQLFRIDQDGNRTALTSPYTTGNVTANRQYAATKQDEFKNFYANKEINDTYMGVLGHNLVAIPAKEDTYSQSYTRLNDALSGSKTQTSGSGSGGGSGSGSGGGYGSGSAGAYNTNTPYIEQLNSLYDQIMNRKPFQYDLNGDLLYRQMADQYTQLGQQAMRDTMGQAAALTGGYGNSYAQQVGNQAYQQYLTALNQQIPDLYDRAYNVYNNDMDWLLQQYQMAAAHPTTIKSLTPTKAATPAANPASTSSDAAEVMALLQLLNGKSGGGTGTGSTSGGEQTGNAYTNELAKWYYRLLTQ